MPSFGRKKSPLSLSRPEACKTLFVPVSLSLRGKGSSGMRRAIRRAAKSNVFWLPASGLLPRLLSAVCGNG